MVKASAAAAAALAALPLIVVLLTAASPPGATRVSAGFGGAPTALATADIPPSYLIWYMDAAQTCPGLPWSVLAGIGKAESDHGKSRAAGVRSAANRPGAEGPMQLPPRIFAEYAVNADPGHPLSPYDPADAIYTAANMLCANGAGGGTQAASQHASC